MAQPARGRKFGTYEIRFLGGEVRKRPGAHIIALETGGDKYSRCVPLSFGFALSVVHSEFPERFSGGVASGNRNGVGDGGLPNVRNMGRWLTMDLINEPRRFGERQ